MFPWSSNIPNMWVLTDYQIRLHDTILTRNSQQQYCNLVCVSLCLSLSQTLLAAHGFLSLTTHKKQPPISSCVYIINYPITTLPFPAKLVYHQLLCGSLNMKVSLLIKFTLYSTPLSIIFTVAGPKLDVPKIKERQH